MIRKIAVAVLFTLAISVMVYAHCHNTLYCEHVVTHLCDMYWDEPYNNTVHYSINVVYQPDTQDPNLGNGDITAASALWENLLYQGIRIPFNPKIAPGTAATTERKSEVMDDHNVVSWLSIRDHTIKARTTAWPDPDNEDRIVEADIAFNYYINFSAHADIGNNSGHYCLKAIAAHEFGHFAGLLHAKDMYCDSEYSRYTMWHRPSTGTTGCAWESLECEDKYALHHTYTVMNPND